MKQRTGDVACAPSDSNHAVRGRSLACVLALIVAAVASAPVAGQGAGAGTGSIEGVATISSRLTSSRKRVRVYNEPGARATAAPPTNHVFANVIIYLQDVPELQGRASSHSRVPPVMRQHGERFVPHVLPVVAGATVDFPNDDGLYHNVFSLSRAREFDLGRYPRGESKQVQFPKPGIVQVFCHIHSDMTGYVVVLNNPFFVIPDAQGRFSLDGVPAGEYKLVTWHERVGPTVTKVLVEAGRATSLSLHIPLIDAPRAP